MVIICKCGDVLFCTEHGCIEQAFKPYVLKESMEDVGGSRQVANTPKCKRVLKSAKSEGGPTCDMTSKPSLLALHIGCGSAVN